jgi:hypothetical protein
MGQKYLGYRGRYLIPGSGEHYGPPLLIFGKIRLARSITATKKSGGLTRLYRCSRALEGLFPLSLKRFE